MFPGMVPFSSKNPTAPPWCELDGVARADVIA